MAELPESIGNLKVFKLKVFSCHQNKLTAPPQSVADRGFRAVRAWFKPNSGSGSSGAAAHAAAAEQDRRFGYPFIGGEKR